MSRNSVVKQHEKERLLNEIKMIRRSLETVHSNFQNTCDNDLIDSYIYEMNSIHFRYRYLLKRIIEINLTT